MKKCEEDILLKWKKDLQAFQRLWCGGEGGGVMLSLCTIEYNKYQSRLFIEQNLSGSSAFGFDETNL